MEPGDWTVSVSRRGGWPSKIQRRFCAAAVAGKQGGNQRLRCAQVRDCLLNVKLSDQSLLLPRGNDPERFLLKLDVFSGKFQALLVGPHLDVAGRHLGLQQDQDVIVSGDLSVEVGVGGLDRAAETAPEIELPGGIQPNRPIVKVVSWQGDDVQGIGVLAERTAGVTRRGLLLLGKEAALGDSALGAGLQNAEAGHFQGEVLLRRLGHQLIEGRVAENRPPAGVVMPTGEQVGVARVDPGIRDAGVRRSVVWARFEAVVPPLSGGRAAGQRDNQDQEGRPAGNARWSLTQPVANVISISHLALTPYNIRSRTPRGV